MQVSVLYVRPVSIARPDLIGNLIVPQDTSVQPVKPIIETPHAQLANTTL